MPAEIITVLSEQQERAGWYFFQMEINGSDPLLYRVSLSVDPSSGIDLNHFGQIFRRLVRDGVISFRLDDVDHNSLSFSVAIKYI